MSTATAPKIVSASVSDRGLSEKRPENEDSFIAIDQCGIYAVADGVGGAQAGEVASQMAVEILGEAFINRSPDSDPETVMNSAIERANSAIYQMAQDLPQLANMATTIAAVHLSGNVATIAHVGDSRVYRVNEAGVIERETDDHSMVAEEVRAGRMTEAQAESHPSRNIISRALGAESDVSVDLKTISVAEGSSFLLCSDGITRHISDAEITELLASGTEPAMICERLKELCYERGAEDNLTAVVITVGQRSTSALDAVPVAETLDDDDESTVSTARKESSGDTSTVIAAADTVETHSEPVRDAYYLTDEPRTADIAGGPSDSGQRSVFADAGPAITYEERPSSLGKLAGMAATLVIGTAIGAGIYHFAFAGRESASPPIVTEMQSNNQALSAFEDNRRMVDRGPAEALARFGADPRDAEDFYLVGRANLLLAKYPEARQAFTESRNKIAMGEVDRNNAKTLETEIAIGLAVINDSTIHSILQNQLASSAAAAGSPSPAR